MTTLECLDAAYVYAHMLLTKGSWMTKDREKSGFCGINEAVKDLWKFVISHDAIFYEVNQTFNVIQYLVDNT